MNDQELHSKDLLLFLREKTLLGYGGIAKDRVFNWQESASIIDEYLKDPTKSSIEEVKIKLQNNNPNCWTYRLQVADPTPIPASFDVNLMGQTQMALIDVVDEIPRIAKNTDNSLMMALTEYGLGTDASSQTLKEIIYDYSRPHHRRVNSFRLDTVAGLAITEAQLAMATLGRSTRLPFTDELIGGGERFGRVFMQNMRELTGKINPTIALVVEAGVAQYWQETNDFRLVLAQIAPNSKVFVVGNAGFGYDHQDKTLYYINTYTNACTPIDAVHTLSDARRLLTPEMLPLLQAVREKAVVLQPSLNPLLNNYHLLRALIFHKCPSFREMFLDAFIAIGCDNPEQVFGRAKKQTIPMVLVDPDNDLDLNLLGFPGEGIYSWAEVIANLKQDNKQAKILRKGIKKRLILRTLLSSNLKLISGGFGSKKVRDFPKGQLINILENSLEGMKELRATGATDKPIVGVETLMKYQPQRVRINDTNNGHQVFVEEIDARQRFCPIYYRTQTDKILQLVCAFSAFSRTNASYKLGGEIYALGPHFL